MPKWIHDRASHIQAKNPSMPESEAFAIATQQSHATGHSPKGYGTSKGKKKAKKKYRTPGDDEQKAAPKSKTAFDLALVVGFSDELAKIAGLNIPPPPTGLAQVKSTIPKSPLSGKTPKYTNAHSIPTPSPAAGNQPVASAPPPVRS